MTSVKDTLKPTNLIKETKSVWDWKGKPSIFSTDPFFSYSKTRLAEMATAAGDIAKPQIVLKTYSRTRGKEKRW